MKKVSPSRLCEYNGCQTANPSAGAQAAFWDFVRQAGVDMYESVDSDLMREAKTQLNELAAVSD